MARADADMTIHFTIKNIDCTIMTSCCFPIMESLPSRFFAYAVRSNAPLIVRSCGVRAPQTLFTQARRQMPEFVAFMVVKGEIHLTDEMPDRVERVIVRTGDIHVVAPDIWQSSTQPFKPGIVFFWFHFTCGDAHPLTIQSTDAVVRKQLDMASDTVAQTRWLIPRHVQLGEELDDFIRAHTELLENTRLWDISDRGTQAMGAALVYRLHRAVVRSRQREGSFIRTAPDVAHVGRAKAYIRLHHERPIALAAIATAINLNPEYLSRCFRVVTGQTVGEVLLQVRIETSKRLLLEGHTVKEAAFHAGFGSASYFCRQFLRVTKTTPLGYVAATQRGKDQHEKPVRSPVPSR